MYITLLKIYIRVYEGKKIYIHVYTLSFYRKISLLLLYGWILFKKTKTKIV